MKLREYRESDLERLREIHRKQGFNFPFPEIDEAFACGCVAVDEQDCVQMAGFIKISSEAYLFSDRNAGTAKERWQALLGIHETIRRDATSLGLQEVELWLPPELTTGPNSPFVRRLKRLGWTESTWKNLMFRLR